jgi:lipopolysaccharide transport system permease protein/teichoic acid transport system permease protein
MEFILKAYLNEIIRRKDLLWYLVTSGLKAQHRNSFLGYLWWMLDPLLGVAVYYFLVVVILRRGGEGYGGFLVVGLVVFRSISSTMVISAKSISSKAGIISQVYLPKAIFAIGTSLSQLINFAFGLLVIAIFLVFMKIVPGIMILWLPFVALVHYLVLLAISLVIAYASVFFRDIENLLGHVVTLLRYGSPVIWDATMIPERYSWISDINPLSALLIGYRNIILHNQAPDVTTLAIMGLACILFIILAMNYYSRHEHNIIKVL